jgi:hypothetical protein
LCGMLRGVSKGGYRQASGCAVIRQSHLIAVVAAFLIAVVVVGCAGVRSQAPQKEEQARSDRCSQTRTFKDYRWGTRGKVFTTNNVPGCPTGGLLSGTDKPDNLAGKDGDDEIRGLGAADLIEGGDGNDVIYGGPGSDFLFDGKGEDVIYGGSGNDGVILESGFSEDGQRDKVYCGPGKDTYGGGKKPETTIVAVDELDYVDSSCEEKVPLVGGTD